MACKIGIIGDGPTDLRVIGRLAECVVTHGPGLPEQPQIIELRRHNIRDAVDKYWQEASKSIDYSISGQAGRRLQGTVFAMLRDAIAEFESQVRGENLSWRDVIVLSTDAERHFSSAENYFDAWAFQLPKILMAATEKIYHELVGWSHQPTSIPTIVPLPLYPSSEVIIAAARNGGLAFHNRSARELKQLLYRVPRMNQLSDDEFNRLALDHITTEALETIFQQIPEVRPFIHVLLCRGS